HQTLQLPRLVQQGAHGGIITSSEGGAHGGHLCFERMQRLNGAPVAGRAAPALLLQDGARLPRAAREVEGQVCLQPTADIRAERYGPDGGAIGAEAEDVDATERRRVLILLADGLAEAEDLDVRG